MEWKEVGDAVAKFAPTLGRLVASAKDNQSVGVKLLVSVLGFSGGPTPQALMEEVQKTGMDVTLKNFETQNLFQLVQFQEPASPATRSVTDVLNQKNGLIAFWSAAVVSVIVATGFFVSFYLLATSDATKGNSDLHLLVGALIAGFTQVISYYLGSSSGSMAKTQLLANSVPKEMAQ